MARIPMRGDSALPTQAERPAHWVPSRCLLLELTASILADSTAVDPQAVRDMQDQMREQDEVHLVSR